MKRTRLALASFISLILCSWTGQVWADAVFFDGTFNNIDWTAQIITTAQQEGQEGQPSRQGRY
jgi:hypothetical protein